MTAPNKGRVIGVLNGIDIILIREKIISNWIIYYLNEPTLLNNVGFVKSKRITESLYNSRKSEENQKDVNV